jgi:PleD family two-component response regulator
VSATVGVAQLGPDGRTADDLVAAADGALLRGKQAGKRRVA